MRDPRYDPQPGDIVKCGEGGTYTVTTRDGPQVSWVGVASDGFRGSYSDRQISEWTDPDDKVIHVAGESPPEVVASSPLDDLSSAADKVRAYVGALERERDKLTEILRAERAHGFRERDQIRADRDQAQADYARAQQTVRGQSAANVLLTQEAQRLRADLAAMTADRAAAVAELRSWNADREEWRTKAAPTPKPPTACGRTWGTNCMGSPGAAHVCRDVSGHDELCCCSCCGAVGLVRKVTPDQPAPSGGTGDCWRELISYAEVEGYPQPLLDAMSARRALGIERYGQPLRRGDGRDHRRDLAEELLDAAVYAYADGTTIAAFDVLNLAAKVVR